MRLGVVTDIHHAPISARKGGFINPHQFETVLDRLQRSIDWLAGQGAERIAVLGDLTNFGDRESMIEVMQVLENAGLPVWVIPGNHDHLESGTALADAAAGSPSLDVLGAEPHALDVGWLAVGTGVAFPSTDGNWAASDLPDVGVLGDHPLLVLCHFPILSVADHATAAGLPYAGDMNNRAEVLVALQTRTAPTFVLNGHLHVRHAQASGHILQASFAAQVESLFEAAVVDFGEWNEGIVSWESVSIDPEWDGPQAGLAPRFQRWTWDGTAWSPAG